MRIAKQGLQEIKNVLIHILLFQTINYYNNMEIFLFGCIYFANNVLKQTIRTIVDVIATPSIINLDFADLSTIIKNKGETVIGIGQANGQDRV
ncbi:hypothetical protein [Metamycoplasma hominis]|uniref:hypothetical protein n=1 Tax=Metamycoplasma hominis TaxID=2098 RepID=UPI001E49651B|nr:hypothetical protein [Metamycoplasma hominis]